MRIKGAGTLELLEGLMVMGCGKNIWAGAESFFGQVVYAVERVIVFDARTILGMGVLL